MWEFQGPLDEKLENLGLSTMQFSKPKARFEDVWNFYAGKCGYGKKWSKNSINLVIEQKDGGQVMVIDQGPKETHFGSFTEGYVIHVEIRRDMCERTAIRILTTVR